MSTYSLSGTGVQGLSGNVTALHVTITTLPAGLRSGRANPTNHFDIGLIRFGDGTGYFAPIAILGGPQWIAVPIGATQLGYALLNGAVISVAEVIGGTIPFGISSVIASKVLTTPTSPVVFSSIPALFRHLRLYWQGRSDQTSVQAVGIRLNGDTTAANYGRCLINANVTGTPSSNASSTEFPSRIGFIPASTTTAGAACSGIIDIPHYTNTTFWKSAASNNTRMEPGVVQEMSNILWKNTAAVNEIALIPTTGNFATGAIFILYGLA